MSKRCFKLYLVLYSLAVLASALLLTVLLPDWYVGGGFFSAPTHWELVENALPAALEAALLIVLLTAPVQALLFRFAFPAELCTPRPVVFVACFTAATECIILGLYEDRYGRALKALNEFGRIELEVMQSGWVVVGLPFVATVLMFLLARAISSWIWRRS